MALKKLNLAHMTEANGWAVNNQLTATLLNQETGAYVPWLKPTKVRICAAPTQDLRPTVTRGQCVPATNG